jgi:hypothetical protein
MLGELLEKQEVVQEKEKDVKLRNFPRSLKNLNA